MTEMLQKRPSGEMTGLDEAEGAAKRAAPGGTALEHLAKVTKIVADTGDFQQLATYKPTDATTNPSLILQAVQLPQYADLVKKVIADCKAESKLKDDALLDEICDSLIVAFGCEILKIVPGVVSTEVDAKHSFDVDASVAKAHKFIGMYEKKGVAKERILIKLASTWEGCQAARILEAEGIHCNMTLLFDMSQAVAAAEAGATLISPFVGRILDWYKKNTDKKEYEGAEDPGVLSVRAIYNYYKHHGYKTTVMGASFRNVDEILALAGCDKMTVSPALLKQLSEMECPTLNVHLTEAGAKNMELPKIAMNEKTFRWMMNGSPMATEKLAEGIRNFAADAGKLTKLMKSKL